MSGGLLGGLLPTATGPSDGSGPLGVVLTRLPDGVSSSDGDELPPLLRAGHRMDELRLR